MENVPRLNEKPHLSFWDEKNDLSVVFVNNGALIDMCTCSHCACLNGHLCTCANGACKGNTKSANQLCSVDYGLLLDESINEMSTYSFGEFGLSCSIDFYNQWMKKRIGYKAFWGKEKTFNGWNSVLFEFHQRFLGWKCGSACCRHSAFLFFDHSYVHLQLQRRKHVQLQQWLFEWRQDRIEILVMFNRFRLFWRRSQ